MTTRKKRLLRAMPLFLALFISLGANAATENNQPEILPKVIIDTDLDSDIDDAGALAMLYNLHTMGKIELIGVVVTSDDPYAPVCAAALNAFYELPEIPVGFLKNQPQLRNHSRYTRQIAEEYPSQITSWRAAEDAVALYRRLLSQYPDESVVVVTIGHLSSLQGLLQSPPDRFSSFNGKELAHKKIIEWICMGGKYPEGKEANFYRPDPASTIYCLNSWEKKITFCGWELGNLVKTGGQSLKEKLSPAHPVYRGYELYNNFAGRQSWDQMAVLQLTDRGREMFSFVKGTCRVNPDGSNTWEKDENGRHRYAVLSPTTNAATVKDAINHLMGRK